MLRYKQMAKATATDAGLCLSLVDDCEVLLETEQGGEINDAITRNVASLRKMIAGPEATMTAQQRAKLEKWKEGARLFNEVSSTKAIDYMEENELVEPNPAGVARLFREKAGPPAQGGLDKKEIGEYLCKLKPYNTDVREAYTETFDFTGRTFVDSLREYLRSFRLPGESMLIERLFSSWAARFYRNNPQDFAPALLTPEKVEKFRQVFDTAATASAASAAASASIAEGAEAAAGMDELVHSGFMTKRGEGGSAVKRNNCKRRYFEIRR
eukprot:COSAG02_NODE_21027_length_806_cov_0.687412_1_plen_268_part_11